LIQVWWCTPVISAEAGDCEFEVSLGYTVRLCLKKKQLSVVALVTVSCLLNMHEDMSRRELGKWDWGHREARPGKLALGITDGRWYGNSGSGWPRLLMLFPVFIISPMNLSPLSSHENCCKIKAWHFEDSV
jgi:hypothetical protein